MLNSYIGSYQKNNDSIRNEIFDSLTIKIYQLNKNHTTSTGITQFIRDVNRLNYQDEEDNTTKGSNENNFSLMNNTYNTPTKCKNKSHSRKKQNQLPSLSIKIESITNIQLITVKDENEIKEEKKLFFIITKENEFLEKNVRADDYWEKIAKHILNEYHYNRINKLIKRIIRKKFKKIPKSIPNKASRKKNKHFLGMTLKEFYENKELYEENQKEKTFEHNLNIIKK